MSWLSNLLGIGTGLADWALNQYSGLSKSEKQQNDFNAAQAQQARDFSAQQAEVERDWQEEMYAKYNSLQGRISQAKAAGVNPMLAVTGNSVSPMSASAGSPAAPAASGSSMRGPSSDMVGAVLSFSKLKAEIDNINAQTRNANAQALNQEINAETLGDMNQASIKQIMSTIENSKADTELKIAKVAEVSSHILNTEADTKIKIEQLGVMASEVANINADTDVKVAQLQQIASSIANTNEDTRLKAAQILLIGAQTRSEKLMSDLITQNTHLSRAQRKEINARVQEIYQRYDHNDIMYGFEEISSELSTLEQKLHTPKNSFEASIKWLLESFVEVLSLGGYTSYNQSSSRSTTTIIDGNPQPERKRVGF